MRKANFSLWCLKCNRNKYIGRTHVLGFGLRSAFFKKLKSKCTKRYLDDSLFITLSPWMKVQLFGLSQVFRKFINEEEGKLWSNLWSEIQIRFLCQRLISVLFVFWIASKEGLLALSRWMLLTCQNFTKLSDIHYFFLHMRSYCCPFYEVLFVLSHVSSFLFFIYMS